MSQVVPPSKDEGPPTGAEGFITDGFPAPGLPRTQRHITGHNGEGKSVFLITDSGSHQRVMGESQAVANILYSTKDTPIECNGDVDIKFAQETEVSSPSPRTVVSTIAVHRNCDHDGLSLT